MRRVKYIAFILLRVIGKKLCLVWLLVFIICFGLSMSFGIAIRLTSLQHYYLKNTMKELMLFADSSSAYYSDEIKRDTAMKNVNERLLTLPGINAVYEQITFFDDEHYWSVYLYPSELINRFKLPTFKNNIYIEGGKNERLIWLDNRLLNQYAIGDRVKINSSFYSVMGFLNKENAHYNLDTFASYETHSTDFINVQPDSLVCVILNDSLYANVPPGASRSCAKFLLTSGNADINSLKSIIRRQGLGYLSSADEIIQNDMKNINLMTAPIIILCVIMLFLTLIGFAGTQMQLFNLYRYTAFSLVTCGMEQADWEKA